jgi:hypothetical protein
MGHISQPYTTDLNIVYIIFFDVLPTILCIKYPVNHNDIDSLQ